MKLGVVGGGITGLAAALELFDLAPTADITVFEATSRLGGKILTESFAGKLIDVGPDAFLARVPWAIDFCRRVGILDELVSPTGGGAFVFWRNQLRPVPEGLVLGVPTKLPALATSGLLSLRGMVRAGLEPIVGRRRFRGEPDNVGAIIRHHFGSEVVDRIVDPLLGGIYAGTADAMSLEAAAPQLSAGAGSMLLSLRRQLRSAPSGPVFFAPQGGMITLVNAAIASMPAVTIRCNSAVHQVQVDGAILRIDGERFDAVIVAAPAPVAASILVSGAPDSAHALGAIDYASVAMITVALPIANVPRALDASGFLVPRSARRFITACSWGSTKWSHWKPHGQVILRVSAGSIDQPGVCEFDDETIIRLALEDLDRLMGPLGPADEIKVNRWPNSFPQYRPGHLDRVSAIESSLSRELPGVFLVGAAVRGIGVPACIRQGRDAARSALSFTRA